MKRLALFTIIALALGCTDIDSVSIGDRGAGESCGQLSDCMAGFDCVNKTCVTIDQPDTTGRAGTACSMDGQCNTGLCCGNQKKCRGRLGDFEADRCGYAPGIGCGLSADCDVGLLCNGLGICSETGGENLGALGDPCMAIADCRRPLVCGLNNTCEKLPFFPGVSCLRSEEELGAFRGYFEVPRKAEGAATTALPTPLDEFYRLPFPTDIRVIDGVTILDGHPGPGEVLGVDFTKLYSKLAAEDLVGFGLSQPIFMRFSDVVDRSTATSTAAEPGVMLVNIDTDSPNFGATVPSQTEYKQEAGQFICHNSIGVAPLDGRPLEPSTTYAVIVSSKIRNKRGEAPIHDVDFATMLARVTPNDADLALAHRQMRPLRDYIEMVNMKPEDIALATVFTTGDPASIGPRIREAVRAAPQPSVVSPVVRCDTGVNSPCAEPDQDRDCPAAVGAFHQFHAKISNPFFQQGVRPYPSPGPDGRQGSFVIGHDGRPVPQGTEELCVAISIPTSGPQPPNGWPIVLYAHGTGGNYLSGMRQVAAEFASRGIAMLTFDNVMHGPRQGLPPEARQDPGRLFFTPANPRAARDNVLQGAADIFNLVRYLEAATLSQTDTGLGFDVTFDPGRLMFYGHSQGTVIAPPALAYEPALRAAVLTGAGAEIGLTLINKRQPNDIASLVRLAFGDQSVSRVHPMIGLLSWYYGSTDGLPYAGAWSSNLDIMHVYGVGDGFTPDVTQQALVKAGGYPVVGDVVVAIDGVPTVANGASANLNGHTAGAIQVAPETNNGQPEYDGHFVGTRSPTARAAIAGFLQSASVGATPAVIQR